MLADPSQSLDPCILADFSDNSPLTTFFNVVGGMDLSPEAVNIFLKNASIASDYENLDYNLLFIMYIFYS